MKSIRNIIKSILKETFNNNDVMKLAGKNSVVLITGKEINGKKRLYANYAKNIIPQYNRVKMNNKQGEPAKMAILGNDFYRIKVIDGKLRLVLIDPTNITSILNLKHDDLIKKIVLNSKTDKTPLWYETIKYTNIQTALNNLTNSILSIPNLDLN